MKCFNMLPPEDEYHPDPIDQNGYSDVTDHDHTPSDWNPLVEH